MSRKVFAFIGLIATSVALTIPIQVSQAQIPQPACVGSECNGEPPDIFGCDAGASPVVGSEKTFGSYVASSGVRTITVTLIYSQKCKVNWSKADVPTGTVLYVEERDGGKRRGYYKTAVNGVNFSDMSNGTVENKACAWLPNEKEPRCTDWFK